MLFVAEREVMDRPNPTAFSPGHTSIARWFREKKKKKTTRIHPPDDKKGLKYLNRYCTEIHYLVLDTNVKRIDQNNWKNSFNVFKGTRTRIITKGVKMDGRTARPRAVRETWKWSRRPFCTRFFTSRQNGGDALRVLPTLQRDLLVQRKHQNPVNGS